LDITEGDSVGVILSRGRGFVQSDEEFELT